MEEDKELYKEFLNGNKESFEIIINKYMEGLIYFIFSFVKRIDIAEDLAQDVFVYILLHKENYDNKYSLKSYLYTIARCRALNYIKREKKIVYLEDNSFIFTEYEIEESIFLKEKNKKLKNSIKKLPKSQQQVIYLVDIEELSYKEICSVLDMSLPKVKSLIHRGRKNLKKILLKEVNFYE